MKILFVLECANQSTNGTTASCICFAKEREKRRVFRRIKDKKEGKDLNTLHPRKKDTRLIKRLHRDARKQELHPEKYL